VCYADPVFKPVPNLVLCCNPGITRADQRRLCDELGRLLQRQETGAAEAADARPSEAASDDVLRITVETACTGDGAAAIAARWDQSRPVVVEGLLTDADRAEFSLRRLIAKEVTRKASTHFVVADGAKGVRGAYGGVFVEGTYAAFMKSYYGAVKLGGLVVRIKDLPAQQSFADTYPTQSDRLRREIERIRTFDVCTYGGAQNVAAHTPKRDIPPDLGPKTYVSLKDGETNIHLDMSDAFNVLVEVVQKGRPANDAPLVGAVWYMWSVEDQQKVPANLARHKGAHGAGAPVRCLQVRGYLERKHEWPALASLTEPGCDTVHDQVCFCTEDDVEALKRDHGVVTWVIEQRLGDAVFIPAGCLHQVNNVAPNTKVAMDFVSPGHVAAMVEVAGQFRRCAQFAQPLAQGRAAARRSGWRCRLEAEHPRAEDRLQVVTMLYHCLLGAVRVIQGAERTVGSAD
jgi:hypothetical protein